jgi:hypothetical protein
MPTDDRLIDPDCAAGKCSACVGGPCEHDCHQQTDRPDPPTITVSFDDATQVAQYCKTNAHQHAVWNAACRLLDALRAARETPPADGDLRDLIEAHIAQVYDRSCAANVAQVAVAIVGPRLERLRAELAEVRAQRDAALHSSAELGNANQAWQDAQTGLISEREDAIRRAVAAEAERAALKAAIEQGEVARFAADVQRLTGDYSDQERDVIALTPFAATLDQLCLEKYGIDLDALDAPSGAHSPTTDPLHTAIECVLLDHADQIGGETADPNISELAHVYRQCTGWTVEQETTGDAETATDGSRSPASGRTDAPRHTDAPTEAQEADQ